jgi:hypothetical protein
MTADHDDDRPNADSGAEEGDAVDKQGLGVNPTDANDPDEVDDPKQGGTPVHRRPTADIPHT